MQLKLKFNHNQHLTIVLRDNEPVRDWYNFWKENPIERFSKSGFELRVNRFLSETFFDFLRKKSVEKEWLEIRKNVTKLEAMGFKVPFEVPETFDYSQETCNNIHHLATYNAYWLGEHLGGDSKPNTMFGKLNPLDKDFVIPDNISENEFAVFVGAFNNPVHRIENFCTTENKEFIEKNFPITYYCIFPTDPGSVYNSFKFDDYQTLDNLDYSKGPAVLLNKDMAGKPYLSAFYDNEDPRNVDIVGRHQNSGGIFIDMNENRKKLYESQKFKDWTKTYGLDVKKLPLDFQLGYVSDSSMSLNKFFWLNPALTSVEFID